MNNLVGVDKGALKMAINVLERAGKKEVIDALRESCVDIDYLVNPNEQSDIEVIHNGDQGEKTLLRDDNLIGWVLRLMGDNLDFQPASGLCELSSNELRRIADIIDSTEKEIKESE